MLAAMAEPTRFRIVELLSAEACSVGEVAQAIGALQPQTTKHVQALEAAGVIRVHKLGRRRVARLNRDAMRHLSHFFAGLATPDPDDAELDRYEAAIAQEETRLLTADASRVLTFRREISASVARVWAAWTDPVQAAGWWAPRHFDVEVFEIADAPGAPIRLTLREGRAQHRSIGRVDAVDPYHLLEFHLSPVDAGGLPLFSARHTLTLNANGETTTLTLRIAVSEVRAEAAPAVAGLEPGWNQLLDTLKRALEH